MIGKIYEGDQRETGGGRSGPCIYGGKGGQNNVREPHTFSPTTADRTPPLDWPVPTRTRNNGSPRGRDGIQASPWLMTMIGPFRGSHSMYCGLPDVGEEVDGGRTTRDIGSKGPFSWFWG